MLQGCLSGVMCVECREREWGGRLALLYAPLVAAPALLAMFCEIQVIVVALLESTREDLWSRSLVLVPALLI